MQDFSPETQAAFKELFAAVFKRIAGIGHTTGCEVAGCAQLSVNCCCYCDMALCMEHSHPAISDEGYDAFACPGCYMEAIP